MLVAPSAQRLLPDLGSGGAYLVGVGFAVLLLVSVLVHELAHAHVARRRGVAVREIALTLVGGHTEMARASTPATSALVAVAGPLANLVLAALAWWAWRAVPAGGVAALLLLLTASSNAFVAAFNLIPGLPMDGGWVLEALVWRLTGRRSTGTLVAAWIGRVVSVVVIAVAVLPSLAAGTSPDLGTLLWAVVIGATLWAGAGAFLRAARTERAAAGLSVHRLMVPAATLPGTATLAHLDALGSPAAVVVVSDDGRPFGHVDPRAAAAVPAERRASTTLDAVAVPLPPDAVVAETLTGPTVLRALAGVARTSPVMVVVAADGTVRGLLRYRDVVSALRSGS